MNERLNTKTQRTLSFTEYLVHLCALSVFVVKALALLQKNYFLCKQNKGEDMKEKFNTKTLRTQRFTKCLVGLSALSVLVVKALALLQKNYFLCY